MFLSRIVVHNLRNLQSVDIQPCPGANFLYGRNGSGKTSLLESLALVGLGRSFRTRKVQPIISHNSDKLTVFTQVGAEHSKVAIGIQRDANGEVRIKIDGEPVSSVTEPIKYLPTQVIDQSCFALLDGSPKVRRQFIDWMVFHVEPKFHATWRGYQKSLKQRNSLLRRGRIAAAELSPWDQALASLGEQLDSMRKNTVDVFLPGFYKLLNEFEAVQDLSVHYNCGWPTEVPLLSYLNTNHERDLERGHTTAGPHRADLVVKVGKNNAADTLSRGQRKTLVSAMKVAQGLLVKEQTGKSPLYLVDDLTAELDVEHQVILARWLTDLQSQVIVTGVDLPPLLGAWNGIDSQQKVFHVEQGVIKEIVS